MANVNEKSVQFFIVLLKYLFSALHSQPNGRILMYSFKDLLNDIFKKEDETTNIEQSHVMISQREMTSFKATDQQDVPHPMTSSNEADDFKGLEISDVRGSPSQYFQEEHIGIRIESKVVELPSRFGNGQHPYRNTTGHDVNEKVRSPFKYRSKV